MKTLKKIAPIVCLLFLLGCAAFTIWWVSRPSSTAPQNMPTQGSIPTVVGALTTDQPTDPYGQVRITVGSDPYGRFTSKWVINPTACTVVEPGITTRQEADHCIVEVDRQRFSYLYGRGAIDSFDLTSPRNSNELLVVRLKGEAFSLFAYEARQAGKSKPLPEAVALSVEVAGFDVTPYGIEDSDTGRIDHN